jgi:hypothetical protein
MCLKPTVCAAIACLTNPKVNVVKALLSYGADIYMGSDDTTPVFAAIEYNHLECLSLLLECTNVDMNRTKNCGCTAWHVAIKKGRLECLQKLLEKGIDIERVNESFETAAITATCQVYYLYTTYYILLIYYLYFFHTTLY